VHRPDLVGKKLAGDAWRAAREAAASLDLEGALRKAQRRPRVPQDDK